MENKEKIKEALIADIAKRRELIQDQMNDLRADLQSESKSTSGDKHETGRAMIQLEMENLGKQFENWNNLLMQATALEILACNKVSVGSIVSINSIRYYFSVSYGKLMIDNEAIMCLSPSSPLGQKLLGLKANDLADFNGNKMKIDWIE